MDAELKTFERRDIICYYVNNLHSQGFLRGNFTIPVLVKVVHHVLFEYGIGYFDWAAGLRHFHFPFQLSIAGADDKGGATVVCGIIAGRLEAERILRLPVEGNPLYVSQVWRYIQIGIYGNGKYLFLIINLKAGRVDIKVVVAICVIDGGCFVLHKDIKDHAAMDVDCLQVFVPTASVVGCAVQILQAGGGRKIQDLDSSHVPAIYIPQFGILT